MQNIKTIILIQCENDFILSVTYLLLVIIAGRRFNRQKRYKACACLCLTKSGEFSRFLKSQGSVLLKVSWVKMLFRVSFSGITYWKHNFEIRVTSHFMWKNLFLTFFSDFFYRSVFNRLKIKVQSCFCCGSDKECSL